MRIWDVATGKPRIDLEGCQKRVHDLAFSPDGSTAYVTTGGGDGEGLLGISSSGFTGAVTAGNVTVIDRDYEPGVGQFILAHEFVHSIQDSQFNLNTVYGDANTEDRVMGVRSVIEGDADHTALAWFYDAAGYRSQDIDWGAVHADEKAYLQERAADPEVALVDTASSFPYSYGSQFMTNLTLAEGLAGRTAAFGSPPESAVCRLEFPSLESV